MVPNVDGGQEIRGQERGVQSGQSETCQQLDVIGGIYFQKGIPFCGEMQSFHLTRRPIYEVTYHHSKGAGLLNENECLLCMGRFEKQVDLRNINNVLCRAFYIYIYI